jgi:predicted kinase/histidinol phosphatase-like enzyme
MGLSDLIVPLPGATQAGTARAIARATRIVLSDRDREQLDERVPSGRVLRPHHRPKSSPPPRRDGEVVLIMGLPGAGKSTLAATLTTQGYMRINRDESGGTLRQLVPALDRALAAGTSRIVLDNTYVSRKSRAEVIRAAAERGFPVRCLWLATSIEDAQTNAAQRIVSRYGRLPSDAELNALRKHDVSAFLPAVQFRYQRELEPPEVAEGFSTVEVVAFERRYDPTRVDRAILVWCDGVLLRSRSGHRVPPTPDDVEVTAERAEILRRYASAGWHVLGLSWQPEIAEGVQSADGAAAVFARMRELLDLAIDVEYCPHAAGPPACWCRKPLPGLGVALVERNRLDPRRCIYVASGSQDPGFARRLGFQYAEAAAFFSRADAAT